MRHLLFGDGMPRNILNADGETTVFSTAIDDDAVWAITLYLWWHEASEVPLDPPSITAFVENNGVVTPGNIVALLPAAYFTAKSAAQAPDFAPMKIIDRLCLRGSQVLKISNSVGDSANCFVYGYAERVGRNVFNEPYRPLQPVTPPVSPFNGDPQPLLVADTLDGSRTIHQLSGTYVDYLSLNIGVSANTAAIPKLIFPNGSELLMPYVTAVTQLPFYPVLDGIPMRAVSSSAVNIVTEIENAEGETGNLLQAYGHFLRN